jgi:hypothetical protein
MPNQSRLTGLTPVAKTRTMPTGFAPVAYHEPNQLDSDNPTRSYPTITQLIMWKVHVAHNREHGYQDSLHSVEIAQLYPQVGDSIAS